MADLEMRNKAFVSVRVGLVCHTSLKNLGRLVNAENLSLSVTSAIQKI